MCLNDKLPDVGAQKSSMLQQSQDTVHLFLVFVPLHVVLQRAWSQMSMALKTPTELREVQLV